MPSKNISLPDTLYLQLAQTNSLTSARICTLVRLGLEVERLAALQPPHGQAAETPSEQAEGLQLLLRSARRGA